ncbi:MAG: flippase [Saprospiraceae bacterium]|nr:flippase [Saprospiraceae bacterium]
MANSSLLKASSYSLLGYAAQLGLAFVSFLLLVRAMSPYDFGVWVLFLTPTSFAEMGRIGLTQNAVVKFYVEAEADRAKIFTAGLVLNVLCTLILSLLLIALSYPLASLWSAPELPALMLWYPAIALVHGTARYLDAIHMGQHDFKGIFWSKSLYGAGFIIGIIWIWWNLGQVELAYLPGLQLIAAVPSLLVYAIYKRSYLTLGPLVKDWIKQIFHFGKFVLGTNFSSMFFNKVDLLMLAFFLNPIAVGLYNVATRITNYMEVPMSGISQAIYPRLAQVGQEQGYLKVGALYERSVGYLLALTIPIVGIVFFFPEPIIQLVAGTQYREAAPVLSILVIAVLVKPWGRLFGITLDAIGKPKLNFYFLLSGLLLNIILNGIMIQFWGLKGAAIATLLSLWTFVIAGQLFIGRIIPIRQSEIWRRFWIFYKQPMTELRMQNL